MHGGPLKPSVHLFSFRDLVQIGAWCKGNGGTRVSGFSCTKSAPASGPNAARLQPPQPVVKSTHMSTFVFSRIIIR